MKNFTKGSVSIWIILLIVVIAGIGYFIFKKTAPVEQEIVSNAESISQTVSETNSIKQPVSQNQSASPSIGISFKVNSKIVSHDTRGSKVTYSVDGKNVIKDSRFSFWRITITCTAGITVKDDASKNICNQPYELRTSEEFSAIISNANNNAVSVTASAELLSEKDRTMVVMRSSADTLISPDFMGTIEILSPTANQALIIGTIEKIKFSAPYEINAKTISISATNGDVTYYLNGLNQTLYSNPMSYVVEFSWDVGKYSHNSVTNKGSGTLPTGNYKLQVTDGNWSSNYVSIVIK